MHAQNRYHKRGGAGESEIYRPTNTSDLQCKGMLSIERLRLVHLHAHTCTKDFHIDNQTYSISYYHYYQVLASIYIGMDTYILWRTGKYGHGYYGDMASRHGDYGE